MISHFTIQMMITTSNILDCFTHGENEELVTDFVGIFELTAHLQNVEINTNANYQ